MIGWTPIFPKSARPLGYLRLLLARYRYFEHVGFEQAPPFGIRVRKKPGYQDRLAMMRDRHKNRRCFIIANGPSLKNTDTSFLRNEVTMGCNGIYKAFPEWGFHTTYLFFEDIEQLELRRKDIPTVKGPVKLAAIYNAYALKPDRNTLFFNSPRMQSQMYYWTDIYPLFSKDFAGIVHLGGSIVYIMLQFVYHLGCDPVYIIGLDHDYGELPKLFPPGKIEITEENFHLVKGLHFKDGYYKIGDKIGVPFVEKQEQAYAEARKVFEDAGRKVCNASMHTKLEIFERCDYRSIFT